MEITPLTRWIISNKLTMRSAAERLDVACGTVHKWSTGKMNVGLNSVAKVERITGIPREELRPDVYSSERAQ
jgi:DNA-binding transcriptional regulator YdaS (Cro superfamily)